MEPIVGSSKHPLVASKLHSNARSRKKKDMDVHDPLMPGKQDDVWRARSFASTPQNHAVVKLLPRDEQKSDFGSVFVRRDSSIRHESDTRSQTLCKHDNCPVNLKVYDNVITRSNPQKSDRTLFVGVASGIAGFTILVVVGVLVFLWVRDRSSQMARDSAAELPIQMPDETGRNNGQREEMTDVQGPTATSAGTGQVEQRVPGPI